MEKPKPTSSPLNPHAKPYIPIPKGASIGHFKEALIKPASSPNTKITALAISPDEQFVAYAMGGNKIGVCNAQSGASVATFQCTAQNSIGKLAMNSTIVVSKAEKFNLEIHDFSASTQQSIDKPRSTKLPVPNPQRDIRGFAISPNSNKVVFAYGTTLATWEKDKQLEEKEYHEDDCTLLLKMKLHAKFPNIFQTPSNTSFWNTLKERVTKIYTSIGAQHAKSFVQERYIASASDKVIRLWRIESGQPVATLLTYGQVSALALSAKNTIVAGLDNGSVKMWRLQGALLTPPAAQDTDSSTNVVKEAPSQTQCSSRSSSSSCQPSTTNQTQQLSNEAIVSHYGFTLPNRKRATPTAPQIQSSSSASNTSSLYQPSAPITPVKSSTPPKTVNEYLATRDDYIGRHYGKFLPYNPDYHGQGRLKPTTLQK